MGLKKFNYRVKTLDVVVPDAYAKLADINIDSNGRAHGLFIIQQDREAIDNFQPFELVEIICNIDKTLPIYEQIYNEAKKTEFSDWTDDIV